jgi:hypothetical protein
VRSSRIFLIPIEDATERVGCTTLRPACFRPKTVAKLPQESQSALIRDFPFGLSPKLLQAESAFRLNIAPPPRLATGEFSGIFLPPCVLVNRFCARLSWSSESICPIWVGRLADPTSHDHPTLASLGPSPRPHQVPPAPSGPVALIERTLTGGRVTGNLRPDATAGPAADGRASQLSWWVLSP